MTIKKQVNLWLPAENVAALDRLAKGLKRSRSNLIGIVLEEYVNRSEVAATEAGNGTTDSSVRTGDRL